MKLFKKCFLTALSLMLIAGSSVLPSHKAYAADNVTYTVKYIAADSQWRVQPLKAWDSSQGSGDMNYLTTNLKDGDSIVVSGDSSTPGLGDLKTDVSLKNITILGMSKGIVIHANKPVNEIYVLQGSVASINGTYNTVYVYDDSTCNINNDVKNLKLVADSTLKMTVKSLGAVASCEISNSTGVIKRMNNVKAGSLNIEKGEDKTPASDYTLSDGTANTQTSNSKQAQTSTDSSATASNDTTQAPLASTDTAQASSTDTSQAATAASNPNVAPKTGDSYAGAV
ncbi:MAG: hypothetical protein K6F84_06290, partial [Lachnospiraceae bacterium]|nr:hypothetical protein [Lachnospiraceae bacterium]